MSGRRWAPPTCSPASTPTNCATGPTIRTGTGRDRFLLSTGHYAIGLYAALAEAGIIAVDELDSYGSDGSRLPMSGMASYTPGMEISGGSLGHGLTVAVGMALGLRHQGSPVAGHQLPLRRGAGRGLDVGSRDEREPSPARKPDRAGGHQRAAGRRPHRRGAAHRTGRRQMGGLRLVRSPGRRQRRRRAAGRLRRRRRAGGPTGTPSVILCDTRVGCGVPLLETREKAHFMRIDPDEWQLCRDQLTAGYTGANI